MGWDRGKRGTVGGGDSYKCPTHVKIPNKHARIDTPKTQKHKNNLI
jgi:hypothetical protein